MASRPITPPTLAAAVEAAARELVRVSHWGDASYVNLPIVMPSGSFATVRVTPSSDGFRVDDGGFAFREIESIGAERSFPKTAASVAEAEELSVNRRVIFVDAPQGGLVRAICDVGMASHDIATRIFASVVDADEAEIEDYLRDRLEHIFGKSHLDEGVKITGSSTNEWEVSAILHGEMGQVVFQAVGNDAFSLYRTTAAFHDLGELPNPPRRVAVVKDRNALGVKLNVLAQSGSVIQGDQSDDAYVRAAAWAARL